MRADYNQGRNPAVTRRKNVAHNGASCRTPAVSLRAESRLAPSRVRPNLFSGD